MLTIKASQKLFFTADKVLKSLSKAEAKVLSRFGAFVRTTAQRSMKAGGKKGKRSLPGEPPRTHGNRLLRKFLFFVYEPSRKSVVIGPALLNGKARANHGKTVPETLEYSGIVDTNELNYKGQWLNQWDEKIPAKAWKYLPRRRRQAKIESRPYMGPAYAKNKPKLMDMWRNAMEKV